MIKREDVIVAFVVVMLLACVLYRYDMVWFRKPYAYLLDRWTGQVYFLSPDAITQLQEKPVSR